MAFDPDSGVNAEVTYSIEDGNVGGVFELDRTSGNIYVVGDVDREIVSTFQLQVQAQDNGSPPKASIAQVIVDIIDKNDNAPRFEGAPYGAVVQENSMAGQQVAAVYASDPDEGLAGMVVYALYSNSTHLPFYLQMAGQSTCVVFKDRFCRIGNDCCCTFNSFTVLVLSPFNCETFTTANIYFI